MTVIIHSQPSDLTRYPASRAQGPSCTEGVCLPPQEGEITNAAKQSRQIEQAANA